MCGPHLQECVRGATVSFGWPGVPGTACHPAVGSGSEVTISYSTVGGIELSDTVWGWTLSTLHLLWRYVRPAKSIFSAVFWLREKFRSLLQIYESVLATAAQKSWLSAPPGKYLECYTHPHYFSATPYWAADWEELHVFPSKPKLLDW